MCIGKLAAEPLITEPSCFGAEVAIKKLKRYKSPEIDQIQADLMQVGGNTLRSEVQKPNNFILNKEELPQQ
jgi:hypothetical protein